MRALSFCAFFSLECFLRAFLLKLSIYEAISAVLDLNLRPRFGAQALQEVYLPEWMYTFSDLLRVSQLLQEQHWGRQVAERKCQACLY